MASLGCLALVILTYNISRLRISWSHPVYLSLKWVVPLTYLQPLINLCLWVLQTVCKRHKFKLCTQVYSRIHKQPLLSVCHLAPSESTGATSSITKRGTQLLIWSFCIQIAHSFQPPDILLWFYLVVTTLSQLFFPYSLYSFSNRKYISSAYVVIHLSSQSNIEPSTPYPVHTALAIC